MESPYFDSDAQLREVLAVAASFSLEDLKPWLAQARNQFMVDLLGREYIQEVETAKTSDEMMALIRSTIAPYAMHLYLVWGASSISPSGVSKVISDKKKPLTAAELQQLCDRALSDADMAAEAMLAYLEENRDDYPLWRDSDACTAAVAEYIPSARVLDEYVYINRSRKRFRELRAALRRADLRLIRPIIGPAMAAELKAQLRDVFTLTVDNDLLLSYIRPVVAFAACEEAGTALTDAAVDELKQLLYDAPDRWPTWRDSPAYRPTLPNTYLNSPDGAVYAV